MRPNHGIIDRHSHGRARAGALALVLLLLAGAASGCAALAKEAARITVTAIATDALGPDPFFDEFFGTDAPDLRPGLDGGTHTGTEDALFGGTLDRTSCDRARLEAFLTDPANRAKAEAWAALQNITVERIPAFLSKLSPVLLRNDTLVRNSTFKKGRGAWFDVLLEAGIAVLINARGEPVVKCNCGNPLGPLEEVTDGVDLGDIDIEVEFPDRRWQDRYDRDQVTAIKPGEERTERFVTVDVDSEQPLVQETGADAPTETVDEEVLPTEPAESTESTEDVFADIPDVIGLGAEEAAQIVRDSGFEAVESGQASCVDHPGTVIAQEPPGGTSQPAGTEIALTVAAGAEDLIVPDVLGYQASDAEAALAAAGFPFMQRFVDEWSVEPAGTVVAQDPVAGTPTPPCLTTVTLTVAVG